MEYKIAVVDDDRHSLDAILKLFDKYSEDFNVLFKASAFSDGDEILDSYKSQYDIIFLDIEMARCDGMTTAKRIREVDKKTNIVFITNNPNYAIEGYKVGALSYLVKPLKYFSFKTELKRALAEASRVKNEYIMVSMINDSMKLALDDIYYIESYMHKLIYHTTSGSYEVYGTMKEIEEKLSDKAFVRSNSGYIVNLKYIDSIKGDSLFINGEELKISRSKKNTVMDKLLSYYSR